MFRKLVCGAALAAALAVIAPADWFPGDPHKMFRPQLPDPNGLDVNMTYPHILADDWLCSETGDVSDVHFWFSYERDQYPVPLPPDGGIGQIHVSIHEYATVPGSPILRSWTRKFTFPEFRVIPYGTGNQGWYDPKLPIQPPFNPRPNDHMSYFQVNIEDIVDPFVQNQFHRYWLDLQIVPISPNTRIGWKTSNDRWDDNPLGVPDYPAWSGQLTTNVPGVEPQWEMPLPRDIVPNLAFVITPEPASLTLLAVAALLMRRR